MDTTNLIYQYIIDYKKANDGNSPSIRQICQGLNIASTATVWYHMRRLSEAGMIGQNTGRQVTVMGGQWLPPV